MLDRAAPLLLRLPKPLPLEQIALGRRPEELADLMVRLFNLCGAAQGLAARLAMGLPVAEGTQAAISAELAREARFALCIRLPQLLGLPVAPPSGPLEVALFGDGGLEAAATDSERFLSGSAGIAPLLRAIAALDLPMDCDLPMPEGEDVLADGPFENSPAARRADHPLLAGLARGSAVWRALGRAIDACLPLPAPVSGAGWAVAPAARGAYGLAVTMRDGRVSAIRRRTPTDHLLAPGGPMAHLVGRLRDPALAPVALALFDPCVPVAIEEAQHA